MPSTEECDVLNLTKLHASPQKQNPNDKPIFTPRNLVELFCKTVQNDTRSTPPPAVKKVNHLLQQLRYGEVLTNEDVLCRLKEAEKKEKEKKKGKLNKKRKVEQSDDSEVEDQLPALDDDELEDVTFGEDEEDNQAQIEYSACTTASIKVGA